ncbi:MAG: TMEM175 family protein [Pseudomonadota bacterium]
MSDAPTTHSPSEFRYRGGETTRIETFVDAAFAFALTLVVVSFDSVPRNFDELSTALKATPAFLAAFALLMMFWTTHRNWSKRYGLDTTTATLISLALIFVILVYVYPLRALMQAAFSAMSGGWLPSDFAIRTEAEGRALFMIYGFGFFIANACIVALFWHAHALRDVMALSPLEVFLTKTEIVAWSIVGSMGLLSAVLAAILPLDYLGFAGWSYSLLAIIMPFYGIRVGQLARHFSNTS